MVQFLLIYSHYCPNRARPNLNAMKGWLPRGHTGVARKPPLRINIPFLTSHISSILNEYTNLLDSLNSAQSVSKIVLNISYLSLVSCPGAIQGEIQES